MTLIQKFIRITALKFSFSKSTEFSRAFAKDCKALSMYDPGFGLGIPSSLSSENQLRSVFINVTLQKGIFLFNLSGVDLKKAMKGFTTFDDAEYNNEITEWELFMILRNKDYLKKCTVSQRKSSIQKTNHMELNNVIVGTKLNEIQKKSDEVKLVFENHILIFKGLLFETSASTLNKRVKNVQLNNTLGFRAISQLRHLNRNPENYRQLFIQMEGSDDNNKLELLGALRNYRILPRRRPTLTQKSNPRKEVVAKSFHKQPL